MPKPIVLEFVGKSKELNETFDKVGAKSKKFGGSLGTMSKIGGKALAGIAAGAITVGVASIEMADKYEVAHANLETSLKNTGTNFDAVKGSVDSLVKSGEKYGYNAGDIEGALASMTTGLGSSKLAMKDLQLAEDLSAKTGKPLSESAIAVTKAYEGQLRPLKQLGIDLPVAAGGALKIKKAQDALAKANVTLLRTQTDVNSGLLKGPAALKALAAAQDGVHAAQTKLNTVQLTGPQIIDALGKKLSGSAAKQADTFGGKIKAVKAQVQDWGIKIGLWLIPKIMSLISWIQKATDWLGKHQGVAKALGVVLGVVAGTMIAVYVAEKLIAAGSAVVQGVTAAWTAAQWLLNAALDANPIGIVVVAIAALVAGVIFAQKHFSWFRTGIEKAWGMLKNTFGWLQKNWPLVLEILTGPIGLAVMFITDHWDTIKRGFALVKDFISDKVGQIVSFITGIPGRIAGTIAHLWDNLTSGISTAKDWISGRIDDVIGFVADMPGRISGAAYGIFDGIRDAFKNAVNWIIQHWNDLSFTIGGGSFLGMSFPSMTIDTPNIPLLANGGVFQSATLAVIGEKSNSSNREIATPERLMANVFRNELAKNHATAPTKIYNTTVNARTNADAREIAREIAWRNKTSGF